MASASSNISSSKWSWQRYGLSSLSLALWPLSRLSKSRREMDTGMAQSFGTPASFCLSLHCKSTLFCNLNTELQWTHRYPSILFLSSLIYASVIYHRYRRSKKIYARAGSQDSGRAMHNLQDLESGVSNPPTYTYAPHPLSSPSPAEIQHSWSRGQTYMGKQNVMVPSNTMSAEPTGPPTVHEAPSSNTN